MKEVESVFKNRDSQKIAEIATSTDVKESGDKPMEAMMMSDEIISDESNTIIDIQADNSQDAEMDVAPMMMRSLPEMENMDIQEALEIDKIIDNLSTIDEDM